MRRSCLPPLQSNHNQRRSGGGSQGNWFSERDNDDGDNIERERNRHDRLNTRESLKSPPDTRVNREARERQRNHSKKRELDGALDARHQQGLHDSHRE